MTHLCSDDGVVTVETEDETEDINEDEDPVAGRFNGSGPSGRALVWVLLGGFIAFLCRYALN